MLVFARRVKHALDVPVDRSHDTDAREQRWPVLFCDQQQRFHRGRHSSASCSAFDSLVMYVAASRSVTIGFRPGTAIGSTNRLSQDTNLHLPLIDGEGV
jgi:hypothetical protein